MKLVKKTLVIVAIAALTLLAVLGITYNHVHSETGQPTQTKKITTNSNNDSKVEPTADTQNLDQSQDGQNQSSDQQQTEQDAQAASSSSDDTAASSSNSSNGSVAGSTASAQQSTGSQASTKSAPATAGTASTATTTVQQSVRTDGFNFLGQHFDISTFSDTTGGNTPRWTQYIFQWTALPNYYLAEAASSAGSAVRQLSVGSEVVVNGRTYHVTDVRHGMKRLDSMDTVESLSSQHSLGLQTCDDATGTYISTYWFD